MKTPQRKFIVEIKSGRRRLERQPKSIWGDADLKAFSREAQEVAPHLFEAGDRNQHFSETVSHQTHLEETNVLDVVREAIDAVRVSVPEEAAVEVPLTEIVAEPVRQSGHRVVRRPPRVLTDRQPKPTSTLRPDPARKPGERPKLAQVLTSVEELKALEMENRMLKELLVKRLNDQNVWLRNRLARFEST